ncbi:hypothetical protein [Acinetobacter seifertii]|uniref:hypothetical protein n=1 Tax=Acinetobacter seifertii TaxID=1530123 RepID=UPI0019033FF2|nr:hypothetical protein [Acinetobacter seifertii]MBJ9425208.1 hypothetical protein [Acinetobacter seifertii]
MTTQTNQARRFIFYFRFGESAVISYEDAKTVLQEKPDGAQFWNCSHFGKNFRKRTEAELKQGNELYLYTYDCWCPHSKAWLNHGIATCKPYEEQTLVDIEKLENYISNFQKQAEEVDQVLINQCLGDSLSKIGAFVDIASQIFQTGLAGQDGFNLFDLQRCHTELKFSLEKLENAEPSVWSEKLYTALKIHHAEMVEPSAVKRLQNRLNELQEEQQRIGKELNEIRIAQSIEAAKHLQSIIGIDESELDLAPLVKCFGAKSEYINANRLNECLGNKSNDDFYIAAAKLTDAGILTRDIFYQAFDDEPYDGYREDMTLSEEHYAYYSKPDPETGEFGCPMTGEVITEQQFHENVYFTYSTTTKYSEAVNPFFN